MEIRLCEMFWEENYTITHDRVPITTLQPAVYLRQYTLMLGNCCFSVTDPGHPGGNKKSEPFIPNFGVDPPGNK